MSQFLDGLDEKGWRLVVQGELLGRSGRALAATWQVNDNTLYSRIRVLRRQLVAHLDHHGRGRKLTAVRALVAWLGVERAARATMQTALTATGSLVAPLLVLTATLHRPPYSPGTTASTPMVVNSP